MSINNEIIGKYASPRGSPARKKIILRELETTSKINSKAECAIKACEAIRGGGIIISRGWRYNPGSNFPRTALGSVFPEI